MDGYAWKHGLCANCCGTVDCCLCWNAFCCWPVTSAQLCEASGKVRNKTKCVFFGFAVLLLMLGSYGCDALFFAVKGQDYIVLSHHDQQCPYFLGCVCATSGSQYNKCVPRPPPFPAKSVLALISSVARVSRPTCSTPCRSVIVSYGQPCPSAIIGVWVVVGMVRVPALFHSILTAAAPSLAPRIGGTSV